MRSHYSLFFLYFFAALSCGEEKDILFDPVGCLEKAIIDEDAYNLAKSAQFEIVSATISGNCLHITISSSGCDGNTWITSLIDRNAIAESSPEQRYVRLVLENDEECDAVFERLYNFDISELQIQNNGILIINLLDFDGSLRYQY